VGLSIAAIFDNPRYHANPVELYKLLRATSVQATNGISSVLSISQNGELAEVEESIGSLHINEESDSLTVYVPMDKKEQEFCFRSLLPMQLEDWLMRDPTTQLRDKVDSAAITVLVMIPEASTSSVYRTLDHQGIIQVYDIPNEDVVYDEDLLERSVTSDLSAGEELTNTSDTLSTPITDLHRRSSGIISDQITAQQSRTAYRAPAPTHIGLVSIYSPHSSEDGMGYRTFLHQVIVAARRAVFPSRGIFDMSGLNEALLGLEGITQYDRFDGPGVGGAFRSNSQLERDMKIGAAGELYVSYVVFSLPVR
jgi:hypothetical protein